MKKRIFSLVLLSLFSFLLSNPVFAGGPEPKPVNRWMFYIGAMGGYYSSMFSYSSTYSSANNPLFPRSNIFNNDVFQQGYSIGGQLGFRYHFDAPYFLGIAFAAMTDENKARWAADFIDSDISSSGVEFQTNNEFRINYNLDIAVLFGIDITPWTHFYAKIGGSNASFSDYFFTTRNTTFPFPTPFFQNTQRKNVWGWVFGLGLSHDLNKWLNAFVEYNYYYYGNQNLNTFVNIAPGAIQPDALVQNVRIHANAVLAGLNLKFMDTFSAPPHYFSHENCWALYLGAFGGYYSADFNYRGNFFSDFTGAANQIVQSEAFQQAASIGAQLGIQYHFDAPYFTGLVVGIMTNTGRARLSDTIHDNVVPVTNRAFQINNEFRINNNLDMAWVLGADIVGHVHAYTKIGATYAGFRQKLFTTAAGAFSFPIPFLQQNNNESIWGFLLGFGVNYDLNGWASVFAEYNHYFYGSRNLESFDRIGPFITAATTDRYTQNVNTDASAFRLGLNIKFLGKYYYLAHRTAHMNSWALYVGGFGGYRCTNFGYGANYFTNISFGGVRSNEIINNNAFQKGFFGGGQIGIRRHFRSPYYIDIVFSGMSNERQAHLTSSIERGIAAGGIAADLSNEFKIDYNFDIAGIIGGDVTQYTHFYAKFGASCARFVQKLSNVSTFPPAFFRQINSESIWGFVLGVGLSHDIAKWVSVFAEYDHYDYGTENLKSIDNLNPAPTNASDRLTQHIRIDGSSVRVGFNVKLPI